MDYLENYPALRAADLLNAWAYAEAHPDEIKQEIRENEGRIAPSQPSLAR